MTRDTPFPKSDTELRDEMARDIAAYVTFLTQYPGHGPRYHRTIRLTGEYGYRLVLDCTTPGVVQFTANCTMSIALGLLLEHVEEKYGAPTHAVSMWELEGTFALGTPAGQRCLLHSYILDLCHDATQT